MVSLARNISPASQGQSADLPVLPTLPLPEHRSSRKRCAPRALPDRALLSDSTSFPSLGFPWGTG